MKNERRKSTLQFDEEILKSKGFVKAEDGTWQKPSKNVLDSGKSQKHAKPSGTLGSEKETSRPRKSSRPKSSRRKRAAEWIVSLTCYVPRYFDSDTATIATKAIRDELADWLGLDDGDHRVMWEVDQVLTRGDPGVCVVLRDAD